MMRVPTAVVTIIDPVGTNLVFALGAGTRLWVQQRPYQSVDQAV